MFFKNDNDRKDSAPRGIAPLLPLRDIIVFPHMVSQLFVGRDPALGGGDGRALDRRAR